MFPDMTTGLSLSNFEGDWVNIPGAGELSSFHLLMYEWKPLDTFSDICNENLKLFQYMKIFPERTVAFVKDSLNHEVFS